MTSQQIERYKEIYKNATAESIYSVYERPSKYQWQAEERIKTEMYHNKGYSYRILTFNTMMFTCAYLYKNEENEEILVIHTPHARIETFYR